MRKNKKLVFIDALVVVCGMVICYLVLRYLRREFDGGERVFAYLIFIPTFIVLLRGLHTLIHGKIQTKRDEGQSAVRE